MCVIFVLSCAMFICLAFQLTFFNLQRTYAPSDNNRTQKSKSYDDFIFQLKMMQSGTY